MEADGESESCLQGCVGCKQRVTCDNWKVEKQLLQEVSNFENHGEALEFPPSSWSVSWLKSLRDKEALASSLVQFLLAHPVRTTDSSLEQAFLCFPESPTLGTLVKEMRVHWNRFKTQAHSLHYVNSAKPLETPPRRETVSEKFSQKQQQQGGARGKSEQTVHSKHITNCSVLRETNKALNMASSQGERRETGLPRQALEVSQEPHHEGFPKSF